MLHNLRLLPVSSIRCCWIFGNQLNIARWKSTDPFQPPTRPMAPKNPEMTKKLREKTPIGKLDELPAGQHPHQEKEPLPAWPDNTNPNTGEIGGPRGPEPTRYGDWERKGRVSDF